jgi:hypothetical protein
LQEQGVEVERFNLSQSPMAFVENEVIKQALTDKGEAALPMLLTNGQVSSTGRYPERQELANWAGLSQSTSSVYSPAVNELVAMGAAIAANCEPCLNTTTGRLRSLSFKEDMAQAVEMGAKVKDSPHQAVLKLADRLTGASLTQPSTEPDACCGAAEAGEGSGKCCD